MSKIGVFDSGVGGLSVSRAIEKAVPEQGVLFVNDTKNVPYGIKTPKELKSLVVPILQDMVKQGCEVIVVACNSVSTTLIEDLRKQISVPLIAMEPMVKPAAEQTNSGIIAVCATPTTLASKRYKHLKDTYAANIKVLEPDCADWSNMVESKAVDHELIKKQITEVCKQGADVIVLGCTHYHWIEKEIKETAKTYGAEVLQPEEPVIKQLKKVLAQLR